MSERERPAGLYIHIPFCKKLCLYCDFYSRLARPGEIDSYIDAISAEAARRDDFAGYSFDTVFLGGGTPSIMSPAQITRLFDNLNLSLEIKPNSEITIECNPSSVDLERLQAYRDCGINRISLGVQSFNDHHLEKLGRLHDSREAIAAFDLIRRAGFDNASIDLIYGLPEQSLDEWESDLAQAMELAPEHISAYNLIIESGTPFGAMYADGKLELPSEETQSAMYDLLNSRLNTAGFSRYEISNFARKGRECHHNLKYWHLEPYLGLGPAAVSFDSASRRKNTEDLDGYLKAPVNCEPHPHQIESLSPDSLRNEAIMMSLRLSEGLSLEFIKRHFDYDLIQAKRTVIESMVSAGYITLQDGVIQLTSQALFLSDEIILKLI
jgi:oxygen-independent coproporphyrinogen III oxidase